MYHTTINGLESIDGVLIVCRVAQLPRYFFISPDDWSRRKLALVNWGSAAERAAAREEVARLNAYAELLRVGRDECEALGAGAPIAAASRPALDIGAYRAGKKIQVLPSGRPARSGVLVGRLTAYEDVLEITFPHVPGGVAYGGGVRGEVRGKSPASRRRQMRFLSKVRPSGRLWFVTVTYSDDFVSDWQVWKADLKAFIKRVQRKWSGAWVIWGAELQQRKSGVRVGQVAPHFHLIVGGVDPRHIGAEWVDTHLTRGDNGKDSEALSFQGWIKAAWHGANHVEDVKNLHYGAFVEPLDDRKKVFAYVSKYTAKVVEDVDCVEGDGTVIKTGRMWGYRGPVPLHPGFSVPICEDEARELKRLVKRWLKALGRSGARAGRPNDKKWTYRFSRWLAGSSDGCGFAVMGWGDRMARDEGRALGEWLARLMRYVEAQAFESVRTV